MNLKIAGVALLAAFSEAAIVEDGIWTGHDWYDAALKIGVKNGVPYSKDKLVQHRLTAPFTVDGSVEADYLTRDNVKRVQSIMNESDWDRGFPHANAIYTYDNFLKAVAKFPHFCNESNLSYYSLDEMCRRELATIFAHWG